MSEVMEAPQETEEAPKRGRKPTRTNGDYTTTTIRIPKQLAVEVKRVAFVNGSTQEAEIHRALESHVGRVKNSEGYKSRLRELLAE